MSIRDDIINGSKNNKISIRDDIINGTFNYKQNNQTQNITNIVNNVLNNVKTALPSYSNINNNFSKMPLKNYSTLDEKKDNVLPSIAISRGKNFLINSNNQDVNFNSSVNPNNSNQLNIDNVYESNSNANLLDLAAGLGKTVVNTTVQAGKGISGYAEDLVDAAYQIGSSKYNPFMKLTFGDDIESGQDIAKELIQENQSEQLLNNLGYNNILSNGKTIQETLDDGSLVRSDNMAGKIIESVGQQLPSMLIGSKAPGPIGEIMSLGSTGISTFGSGVEEAYNNGSTREEATAYGLMNSAIETATEKMFAGIGGLFGKGALDDAIKNKITSKISNNLLKNASSFGLDMVGEGTEEVISDLLQPIAQKLTYASEEDLQKLYSDQNYLEDFILGALSSAVMQGISLPTNQSKYSNDKNYIENQTLPKNNINNKNLNNQQTSLPTVNINSKYNKLLSQVQDNQNMPINALNNKPNLNENIPNNINILENKKNTEVGLNNIKYNDTNINGKYAYVPTNNEKSNKLRQSAVQNNLNNSQETINLINTIDKIVKDKNYNVLFDGNIVNQNNQSVNARIKTLDNGEIEIRINPNSDKAGEFLLMHEITHAIETNSMKKLVMDYASKNVEFNQALENLKQTYGVDDVSSEVVADISGQLFGNQEFINSLSTKEPNIFKKIYNRIIELANKFTGNSRYDLFVKDLKNKWETAYRTQNNNLSESNFSIQTDNTGKKYVNVDTNQDIFKNKSLLEQTKIAKQYILDNFREHGIEVNNENINVTSRTANEYTHPKKQNSKDVASSKMKASTELDNLLNIAEYSHSNIDDGRHLIAKDGWDYYKVNFRVGNQNFEGLINIAKKDGVKTLYDITRIKKTSRVGSDNMSTTTNVTSSYGNNITNSNENVKLPIKYSMQENINNTQELNDSSFNLQNSEGKKIDISNLKETNYMKQFTFNRKYNKDSITTYRGVGENGGTGVAMYGLGLYTTLDKNYAKQYGNVITVDNSLLPNNPLHFKTQNDFKIWEQELARQLNIKRSELYGEDYGVEQYLNKLGYDGLMIGTGKDTDLISFTKTATKYSQNNSTWQEHLEKNYKTTGTRTNMRKLKEGILPTYKQVKELNKKDPIIKGQIPIKKLNVKKDKSANDNIRKYSETVQKSDVLDQKIIKEIVDKTNFTYVPQSNQKQVNNANMIINNKGYKQALQEFNSFYNSNRRVTANDLALGQRLMQEASKIGDSETLSDLLPKIAAIGTELGQSVQALSIINKLSPEGQLQCIQRTIDRLKNKNIKGIEKLNLTEEQISKILNSSNQQELNKNVTEVVEEIAKQLPSSISEKLNAWRYLSMLGNPKTHIRNIVSNIAMQGTMKVKNLVAKSIESTVDATSKILGKNSIFNNTSRTKTFKKTSQDVKNYVKDYIQQMNESEVNVSKYSIDNQIQRAKKVFGEKGPGGFLQKISDFNSNALGFEDAIFKNSAFKTAMQQYLTANGVITNQDIENNPNLVNNAKEYAIEESLKATFQQYSALANYLNSVQNKAGRFALDSIIPFTKTPINVAKTGVAYSPLGLMKSLTSDSIKLKNGKITPSQYIDNISQGLTGSGIVALGMILTQMGILSGSGDDDKEGKYNEALGGQSYSINIGGNTYSLDWLSPVAMPLFVGSEIENIRQNGIDSVLNMNTTTKMFTTTLDPIMSMSFLQGLNNALSSYSDNKITAVAEESIKSYVGQYFPTLLGQIAKTIDPTVRSTSVSKDSGFTLGEQILRTNMAKIPGLTFLLEPATDVWGNENQRSNNIIERAFENFIAPYSKKENIATNIDNELKEIYSKTGNDSVIPTIYLKKTITYKGEIYSTDAKSYTQLKKTYGETANKYLEKLFKTNTYKKSDTNAKAEMISKVYNYATDEAKKEFLNTKGVKYTNATSNNVDVYRDNYIKDAIESDISYDAASFKARYPTNYLAITTVTDYDNYNKYKEQISSIKEEYAGEENKNLRKNKIAEYIQTLPYNREKKIMLYKMIGGYSITNYKNEMYEYIESLKISKAEKESIWKQLYGGD